MNIYFSRGFLDVVHNALLHLSLMHPLNSLIISLRVPQKLVGPVSGLNLITEKMKKKKKRDLLRELEHCLNKKLINTNYFFKECFLKPVRMIIIYIRI